MDQNFILAGTKNVMYMRIRSQLGGSICLGRFFLASFFCLGKPPFGLAKNQMLMNPSPERIPLGPIRMDLFLPVGRTPNGGDFVRAIAPQNAITSRWGIYKTICMGYQLFLPLRVRTGPPLL